MGKVKNKDISQSLRTQASAELNKELTALQNTEMNKLLRDIGSSDKMRSQGLAQVISAMNKKIETTPKKSGPVFIVMATPLNEEELKSPNVRKN